MSKKQRCEPGSQGLKAAAKTTGVIVQYSSEERHFFQIFCFQMFHTEINVYEALLDLF